MTCKLRTISYTYTVSMQKVLKKSGYTAEIERIQQIKKQGCGYEVKTNCPYQKAVEICKKNNIPLETKAGGNI